MSVEYFTKEQLAISIYSAQTNVCNQNLLVLTSQIFLHSAAFHLKREHSVFRKVTRHTNHTSPGGDPDVPQQSDYQGIIHFEVLLQLSCQIQTAKNLTATLYSRNYTAFLWKFL